MTECASAPPHTSWSFDSFLNYDQCASSALQSDYGRFFDDGGLRQSSPYRMDPLDIFDPLTVNNWSANPALDAPDFSSFDAFDALSASTTYIPLPDGTKEEEVKTISPQQILLIEDKLHDRAEDALKARVEARYRSDLPIKTESSSLSPYLGQPGATPSLKRPRVDRPIKQEVVESISSLSRASREMAPLPKRKIAQAITPTTATGLLFAHSPVAQSIPSPTPSKSSTLCADNDHDEYRDDGEFLPGRERPAKKKKSTAAEVVKRDRKGKKTQLQVVLDDLPYTLDDIIHANGLYHCPFPNCRQTTTSEGDLGRHLESSAHATHGYLCLDPSCLAVFAREDSMKRHHVNNRGKAHKEAHERFRKAGHLCRIKIECIESVKEQLAVYKPADEK